MNDRKIRVGLIRMDSHTMYIGILMGEHDPACLEGPCMIGAGDAPIPEALALAASIGFDGYVSLETEKMYHPEPTVPDAAESFPEFIRYMAASGH